MSQTLRVHTLDPSAHFRTAFGTIEKTRFAGVPALNPRLQVEPRGFRRWGNDWIGVMVTPWSVFAVYCAGNRAGWEGAAAGKIRLIELPGGDFPFTVIEDDVAGLYASMSLMSPAHSLGDQPTAQAFADECLRAMLTANRLPEDHEDADAVLTIPPTADGKLHRVIPIRAEAPKNWAETPALTPKPPKKNEAEKPAPRGAISRRQLFGGWGRTEEKAAKPTKTAEEPVETSAEMPTEVKAQPASTAAPSEVPDV